MKTSKENVEPGVLDNDVFSVVEATLNRFLVNALELVERKCLFDQIQQCQLKVSFHDGLYHICGHYRNVTKARGIIQRFMNNAGRKLGNIKAAGRQSLALLAAKGGAPQNLAQCSVVSSPEVVDDSLIECALQESLAEVNDEEPNVSQPKKEGLRVRKKRLNYAELEAALKIRNANRKTTKENNGVKKRLGKPKAPSIDVELLELADVVTNFPSEEDLSEASKAEKPASTALPGVSVNFCDSANEIVEKENNDGICLIRSEESNKIEPPKSRYFCSLCPYRTNVHTNFQKHMRQHRLNIPLLKCSLNNCEFTTFRKTVLTVHRMRFHSRERPHPCNQCSYVAVTGKHLQAHKSRRHSMKKNEKIVILRCKICLYQTKYPQMFRRHIRSKHMEKSICKVVEDLQCPYCEFVTDRRRSFKIHVAEHEGKTLPTQLCPICGKLLKCPYSMKGHMERIHNPNRELTSTCEICGKKFGDKNRLKQHSLSHSEIRQSPCEICGKLFKNSYAVRNHVRESHEKRPIQCDLCPRSFKSENSLDRHLTAHHRRKTGNSLDPHRATPNKKKTGKKSKNSNQNFSQSSPKDLNFENFSLFQYLQQHIQPEGAGIIRENFNNQPGTSMQTFLHSIGGVSGSGGYGQSVSESDGYGQGVSGSGESSTNLTNLANFSQISNIPEPLQAILISAADAAKFQLVSGVGGLSAMPTVIPLGSDSANVLLLPGGSENEIGSSIQFPT